MFGKGNGIYQVKCSLCKFVFFFFFICFHIFTSNCYRRSVKSFLIFFFKRWIYWNFFVSFVFPPCFRENNEKKSSAGFVILFCCLPKWYLSFDWLSRRSSSAARKLLTRNHNLLLKLMKCVYHFVLKPSCKGRWHSPIITVNYVYRNGFKQGRASLDENRKKQIRFAFHNDGCILLTDWHTSFPIRVLYSHWGLMFEVDDIGATDESVYLGSFRVALKEKIQTRKK